MCILVMKLSMISDFFFFNDTATTEIYTLSLHDALPICTALRPACRPDAQAGLRRAGGGHDQRAATRSEEHTSELQSQSNLVCRLLLEKKKTHSETTLSQRTHEPHRMSYHPPDRDTHQPL